MKDLHIVVPTTDRERATWMHGNQLYIETLVEPDQTVRVFDPISETYTSCHSLPEIDVARAVQLAVLANDGRHYTSAGFVFERGTNRNVSYNG